MWIRRAARHVLLLALTLLLGGLLGATLVRIAPGFGTDEAELDARLSSESVAALRQARAGEQNVVLFYFRYLGGLLRGDMGVSRSLNRPVRELFAERIPVTLRAIAVGLLAGWVLGLALALPVALTRLPAYELAASAFSGIFLCIPSAILAVIFLLLGWPAPLAISLLLFPRVFRYARNLLVETRAMPHVLAAQARGLAQSRILIWHILPSVAAPLIALAGVSLSMAFSAAIPIEVLCDSPGIGQLAWMAALGRDLPLLVNLTMLVALVTLFANSVSDLAIAAWGRNRL